MRAQAREKLLITAVKRLLRDEDWNPLGEALLSDAGGLQELAYRLDEVSDHTAPGLLAAWDGALRRLDSRTYCFIAEDAEDPAAYLATLI